MTYPNQIDTDQENAAAVVNEELATLAHVACYGKKASTTSGLSWGYYGGRWGGFSVADGTLALTASATNYVVVAIATGAISVSTSATHWNDSDNYARVYKITTGASAVSGTPEDHRAGPGGVYGGGGSGDAVDSVNGQTGAVVLDAADVGAAPAGHTHTAADVTDFTEAAQDVIGAMVAAAGGSYNDGAGTVSFPAGTTYSADGSTLQLSGGTFSVKAGGIGPTELASTAVTPGSYTNANITVDADGRVTAAANGSAGGSGGTKTYALLSPMTSQPPASNYATLDTRNSIAVLDFDDTTAEGAFWTFVMPEGASLGSGLIVRLHWMATSATSGAVTWEVSIERMNTDLDADSFDTVATGSSTTNATSGIVTTTAITITTIDSVAAGEPYRVKVRRLPADAGDTMVGDAELVVGEVRSAA